jgi:hypothetical protein
VLAAGVLACLLATAYYCRRVTGDALTLPYMPTWKQYGAPAVFVWQREAPIAANLDARQRSLLCWMRDTHRRVRSSPWAFVRRFGRSWRFYLGFPLSLCLLVSLFAQRRREVMLIWLVLAGVFLWVSLFTFTFPHYVAPYAGLLWVLVMIGMERLHAIAVGRLPLGFFVAVVLWVWAAAPAVNFDSASIRSCQRPPRRAIVAKTLEGQGGAHLVFVRYGPQHDFHDEWVYNAADIDSSSIVWAIELDPESNAQLIRHFAGRHVWLVEPDRDGILRPYSQGF